MKINDDNFEFVFGSTPPPGQSSQDFNLPPEGSTQPLKRKIKPLDLNNPDDYQEALDAVLKEIEDQKNTYEATRLQADKELGRPSSSIITEQDILNCIRKGKLKDTPERLAAIEKEKNDPNICNERGEFYKKLVG
jgi:hypothetical protein